MLYLVLSLLLSPCTFGVTEVLAASYPHQFLLSELPDGATLSIPKSLELSKADYDDKTIYSTELKKSKPMSVVLPENAYTHLVVRTDNENSVHHTSGLLPLTHDHYLNAGVYCLNKAGSTFHSDTREATNQSVDRLEFENCSTGEKAFAIYAVAGYRIRHSDDFKGFTIGRFQYHANGAFEFYR